MAGHNLGNIQSVTPNMHLGNTCLLYQKDRLSGHDSRDLNPS